MDAKLLAPHVDSHPEKCGGKPCVAGTRVRVWDVHCAYNLQGRSVDEVIDWYPRLGRADVHAALAYYWDHQEEIERHMAREMAEAEAMREAAGPGLVEQARAKASLAAGNREA